MVIFKSKQRKFEGDLKIKLCGKILYPTESVRYLGMKIDTSLTWQQFINDLSIKLNRANALFFKVRKHVSLKILKSIYFTTFDSYLSFCCLVWDQNYRQHYSTNFNFTVKVCQNYQFPTKDFPYQIPIQTKLHLIIQKKFLRKYFI